MPLNGNAAAVLLDLEAMAQRVRAQAAIYGIDMHVALHIHDHMNADATPALVTAAQELGWTRLTGAEHVWYESPTYGAEVAVWER